MLSGTSSSGGGNGEAGYVEVDEITEVKKGIHTEVAMKARTSNKALDPLCFLSVITPVRTVDIQLSSAKDRDMFYRALQGLCGETRGRVRFS